MAKLLFSCVGLFSNLSSSLALAESLRDEGFEIVFAAPQNCLSEIAVLGFEVFEIGAPKLSARARYLPRPGILGRFGSREKRMQQAAAEIGKDGFAKVLEAVQPDLVIADCEHHSAIIQSAASHFKVLLLCFMYFTPPASNSPPLTSDIVPGRGFRGTRLGIKLAWALLQAKKKRSIWFAALCGWGSDMPNAHRQLAKSLNFDLEKHVTSHEFQMPWSYQLPTLLLVAKGVDFDVEPATYQHFAGPMVLGTLRDQKPDPKISRYFNPRPDIKRIFVAFGTRQSAPKAFAVHLMKVARRNPNWEFLFANKDENLFKKADIPANVTVVAWAPQYEALKVADCAMFHGGAGTLNECLLTKTPMIVYPNPLDGKGNGARVAFHGLGEMGRYRDTAAKIEHSIATLLSDSRLNDRLRRTEAQIAADKDLKVAKHVVEKLIADE